MRVTYRMKWLRKRLRVRGYVLVHHSRWKYRAKDTEAVAIAHNQMQQASSQVYKLQDEIKILQAEVEAHKRIEAVLAERAMT